MTYRIPEVNYDAFSKYMRRVERKAAKLGLPFYFKELSVEEEVSYDENLQPRIVKYFVVDVEYNVTKEGWSVIALVKPTDSDQNMVYRMDKNAEVPEKYYTSAMICEHCNTSRARNMIWVVRNDETGETKGVGTSCIQLYTGIINSDMLNSWTYLKDHMDEYCTIDFSDGFSHIYHAVVELRKFVGYAYYFTKNFGYENSYSDHPTKIRSWNTARRLDEIPEADDFLQLEDTKEFVDAAIEYAETFAESTSEFEHNIGAVASCKYIYYNVAGFAAYIPSFYLRHLDAEAAEARRKEGNNGGYVGNVGEKVSFKVKKYDVITGWSDNYGGYTWMYRFLDDKGNIYIWKTGRYLPDEKDPETITGTIKMHQEYNGTCQNVITRCKVA